MFHDRVERVGSVQDKFIMQENVKTWSKFVAKWALALSPWIVSMYLLYTFDANGTWGERTDYRDVMTIAILVAGMSLSFLLLSFLTGQKRKP